MVVGINVHTATSTLSYIAMDVEMFQHRVNLVSVGVCAYVYV